MLIIPSYCLYVRQYIRLLLSPTKIFLLTLVCFFVIIHTQFTNQNNSLCDPEKPLWWFCPWPMANAICSWNEHFPMTNQNLR